MIDRKRAMVCAGLLPIALVVSFYLFMRGPEEAVLRVALKHGSGVRVDEGCRGTGSVWLEDLDSGRGTRRIR